MHYLLLSIISKVELPSRVIIDTIKVSSKDAMDILNKTDEFYNNAWGKLIIVISSAFGVIGLINPLLLLWYQRQQIRSSESKLKKEINDNIEESKKKALSDMEKKIDAYFKIYVGKLSSELKAKNHYLQGIILKENNQFNLSFVELSSAVYYYLASGNRNSVIPILNELKLILPLCNKIILDNTFERINYTFKKAIDTIKLKDPNNFLKVDLDNLELIYSGLN